MTYVYTEDPVKRGGDSSNTGNKTNNNNTNKLSSKTLPKTGKQQTDTLSILGSLIIDLWGAMAFISRKK